MKEIPRIKTAFYLILGGVGFGFLISAILLIVLPTEKNVANIQIILLIGELFLPVPIFIWGWRRTIPLGELMRVRVPTAASLLASLPIALGLTIIIDELDRLTQIILPLPEKFVKIEELLRITDWQSAILVIGIVVVTAPLIEEIIFRGFFQRVLEYRLGNITRAVLISALVFAIIHFNIWWAIQIYLLGLFMGYLAWRSDSVFPSFIVHAFNNGWAVLWSHWHTKITWYEWHNLVHPLIIIVALAVFLGGLKLFRKLTPPPVRRIEIMAPEEPVSDNFGE